MTFEQLSMETEWTFCQANSRMDRNEGPSSKESEALPVKEEPEP